MIDFPIGFGGIDLVLVENLWAAATNSGPFFVSAAAHCLSGGGRFVILHREAIN
jgi:hypothetical protein